MSTSEKATNSVSIDLVTLVLIVIIVAATTFVCSVLGKYCAQKACLASNSRSRGSHRHSRRRASRPTSNRECVQCEPRVHHDVRAERALIDMDEPYDDQQRLRPHRRYMAAPGVAGGHLAPAAAAFPSAGNEDQLRGFLNGGNQAALFETGTFQRLGIGNSGSGKNMVLPLAKQLENQHLSPIQQTPPDQQQNPDESLELPPGENVQSAPMNPVVRRLPLRSSNSSRKSATGSSQRGTSQKSGPAEETTVTPPQTIPRASNASHESVFLPNTHEAKYHGPAEFYHLVDANNPLTTEKSSSSEDEEMAVRQPLLETKQRWGDPGATGPSPAHRYRPVDVQVFADLQHSRMARLNHKEDPVEEPPTQIMEAKCLRTQGSRDYTRRRSAPPSKPLLHSSAYQDRCMCPSCGQELVAVCDETQCKELPPPKRGSVRQVKRRDNQRVLRDNSNQLGRPRYCSHPTNEVIFKKRSDVDNFHVDFNESMFKIFPKKQAQMTDRRTHVVAARAGMSEAEDEEEEENNNLLTVDPTQSETEGQSRRTSMSSMKWDHEGLDDITVIEKH